MATRQENDGTGSDARALVTMGVAALALLYLVLFVVFNTATVQIDFVLASTEVPLVVALTLAGLLGAAVGGAVMALVHRR